VRWWVKSTCNWYWCVVGLRVQGRDARLANPAKTSQYARLKASDDASDAGWIAGQLRLGILPESYVYPPQVPPIRDALRGRMLIVRQRTQPLLSLESLFARHGFGVSDGGGVEVLGSRACDGITLGLIDGTASGESVGTGAQAGRISAADRRGRAQVGQASGSPTRRRMAKTTANRYLACAYAEAAVHAIRCYPRIAAWYERRKRRSRKCGWWWR